MRDEHTTWRSCLAKTMNDEGDRSPVVSVAPDDSALDVTFYSGYGSPEGPWVTIWTEKRVYFPVVYDGAEWLKSAPRDPNGEASEHVGGQ